MPNPTTRYTTYVLFALLVLAWTAPFAVVGHTYPIPTFYAEYIAAVLFVLVGLVCGVLMFRSPMLRRFTSPRIAAVPLGFAMLLLAQTVILPTAQPSMNFLGAGALILAAMIVHAGYWVSRLHLADAAMRWTAWGLVAGGLFAVATQLIQLFHLEATFSPLVVLYNASVDRRPFGNMAQANHLATYIAFALAASVYLVQSRQLALKVWLLLAIVYATGLSLTVSRTPWLQVCVLTIVGAAMALSDTRAAMLVRGWRRGRRFLVPLLTLVIFAFVNIAVRALNTRYGWHLAESAADRFKDAGQISPRLSLWKYGLSMFHAHPWLGVGWGEFPRFQYELVEQLGRVEIANNSHDIVIDVLAKTGIVGAAIVVLGFSFWAWRVLRTPSSTMRLFALGMLAVLGVHTLVEYPQQYLFFLFPAAFLIGLLETESMTRTPAVVSGSGYALVTAAGVLLAWPVLADYHRAEKLYYGDRPEMEYRAAPSFFFGAWGEFGLATLLPLNNANLANKLAMHRRAIALLPGEVVLRRYAILWALEGNTSSAMDQVRRLQIFAEALHDWPNQLASLYQLCSEQPGALDELRNALLQQYGPGPANAAAATDDDD